MVNVYKEFIGTNSVKVKKDSLQKLLMNAYIKELITETYNPIYGTTLHIAFTKNQIKSLTKRAKQVDVFRPNVIYQAFNALKQIKSPKQRKELITKILPNKLSHLELHFLLNLLNRDIGVGYKVLAELIDKLPYFPFQLAHKYSDKVIKKLKGENKFIIQPKYDGIRIHFDPQTKMWYTRNQEVLTYKERPNLKYLTHQLNEFLNSHPNFHKFIFDGELYATNWNNTMTFVSSEKEVDGSDELMFIVYDLIDIENYKSYRPKSGKTQIVDFRPQEERVGIMMKSGIRFDGSLYHLTKNVKFAPLTTLNINKLTPTQLHYLMGKYIDEGYEGCMLKVCSAPYVDNRKEYWLKIKPQNELEGVVIDVVEGDGKYQNKLGALIVKSKINGKEIVFRVGSGFSDTQRNELWEKQNDLIGKIVEIKYQELTKDSIPRFPTFSRIREDKNEPNYS